MGEKQVPPANAPVNLAIDVWVVDETYPSLKLNIELIAPHPTGQFVYTANDIWFSASAIYEFVSSLALIANARNETASLADLSDYVQLTVINADGTYSMSVRAHEPKIGFSTGDLPIRCTIDRDTVQFMLSAFRDLPTLKS